MFWTVPESGGGGAGVGKSLALVPAGDVAEEQGALGVHCDAGGVDAAKRPAVILQREREREDALICNTRDN